MTEIKDKLLKPITVRKAEHDGRLSMSLEFENTYYFMYIISGDAGYAPLGAGWFSRRFGALRDEADGCGRGFQWRRGLVVSLYEIPQKA